MNTYLLMANVAAWTLIGGMAVWVAWRQAALARRLRMLTALDESTDRTTGGNA